VGWPCPQRNWPAPAAPPERLAASVGSPLLLAEPSLRRLVGAPGRRRGGGPERLAASVESPLLLAHAAPEPSLRRPGLVREREFWRPRGHRTWHVPAAALPGPERTSAPPQPLPGRHLRKGHKTLMSIEFK
jgi:hypothetical protein